MIEGLLSKAWLNLQANTEVTLDVDHNGNQILIVPNSPHPVRGLSGCTIMLKKGDWEALELIITQKDK